MKFGGTSVASPEKLIDIVRKAVERDRTILVCSAISKCTDTLIRLGKLASERDEKYLAELAALQDRHHAMIASIIPADRQKQPGCRPELRRVVLHQDPGRQILVAGTVLPVARRP